MASARVRYQTVEFDDVDIHLRTLRDTQQYSDDEGHADRLGISSATWPIFGVVWDSSRVLARLMFDRDTTGRRVLEVGCGIGLASLILNHRHADITATDYHPEAEAFLLRNVALNGGAPIPFVRTGWGDALSALGTFDLIIGSDLLYEPEHVELLSGFIDQHARPTCEVLIVDPGRDQRGRFSRKMVGLGYTHSRRRPVHVGDLDAPFGGQILTYTREEDQVSPLH